MGHGLCEGNKSQTSALNSLTGERKRENCDYHEKSTFIYLFWKIEIINIYIKL